MTQQNKHKTSHTKETAVPDEEETSLASIVVSIGIGLVVGAISINSGGEGLGGVGIIASLFAIGYGLTNAREYAQRWSTVDTILDIITDFFSSAFPPIIVGLIIGGISYMNEFWWGVFIGAGLVIIGGYNLYGKMIDGAGDLIEGGVGFVGGKVMESMDKNKQKSGRKKDADSDE